MCALVVASDIGGTFTDTVTIDDSGRVGRYKSPTVPHDPAAGIMATLELAAEDWKTELDALVGQMTLFAHGTTVATNAMLEDRGAKVGLVQTRGFGGTVVSFRCLCDSPSSSMQQLPIHHPFQGCAPCSERG